MKWISTVSIASLLFVLLFLEGAFAATHNDPRLLIEKKYKEIEEIVVASNDAESMREKIKEIMETFIDYAELSRLTLSKHWDKLSGKQRKEFTAEFKKLIQNIYVKRFNPDKKFVILYNAETEFKADKAKVRTTIKSGKSEADVGYLFHKPAKGGSWWAYDVIIDDVSMMKNYRKEFHAIMEKEGFTSLIERIRKKSAKE